MKPVKVAAAVVIRLAAEAAEAAEAAVTTTLEKTQKAEAEKTLMV
jgi:hypothetical protein